MKLPTTVIIQDKELEAENAEMYEQLLEWVSDYLSEQTGFCHQGFEVQIKITASHIMWDVDED